jgi:hypothetical protein
MPLLAFLAWSSDGANLRAISAALSALFSSTSVIASFRVSNEVIFSLLIPNLSQSIASRSSFNLLNSLVFKSANIFPNSCNFAFAPCNSDSLRFIPSLALSRSRIIPFNVC